MENFGENVSLIDFLQKKSADIFVRKFVIFTGFLFSERLAFDYVVRIYIDNLTSPLQTLGSIEVDNVSSMLSSMLYLYFSLIAIIVTSACFI